MPRSSFHLNSLYIFKYPLIKWFIQLKVTLQSEEIISEECRKKSNQASPGIHSHCELKENILFVKKTDLTMQIPVHITPSFVTDISN